MFFFLLLIFLFSIIYLIYTNKLRNGLKDFPQAPPNIFLGHILYTRDTTKILDTIDDFKSKYGSIVRLVVGPPLCPLKIGLVVTDYDFVEYLLTSNKILAKSQNYLYLKPWLGLGLLLSDGRSSKIKYNRAEEIYFLGDKWRKHRKLITPAFHFGILKQFTDTFESVGNIFVDKLRAYNNSSSTDLCSLVSLFTLDVICETAMGTKINAQKGHNSDYIYCVREMCKIVINRSFNALKILNSTFKITPDYYKQKHLLKVLHNFTRNVIYEKKEKSQNVHKSENDKKIVFLDLLLKFSEEGKLLNDEEIREETDTFMFEGHDTTASAICFTLYCLANHPEVQKKVLQEQKDLFGEEKMPNVTYQDLQNMKYLEMVIKETLRLYPSVPVIGRYVSEDIEFRGRKIIGDTNILISLYHIHKNPEYFPEPEKFDPDRFENLDSSRPYIYIPFSAGPRNCIGQKFAMLEIKSIVSKVIRHFELTPAIPRHDLILSVETVLKSTTGVKVGLKERI